jgi:predicted small secreted protein
MMKHTPRLLSLLLLAGATLTACGGGSDNSSVATATVDPTVQALSGLLADTGGTTATSATDLAAELLPPDPAAALAGSLLPPG